MISLSNGVHVPALAYGTGTIWFNMPNRTTSLPTPQSSLGPSVKTALKLGFRHLDNAEMYNTEAEVGAALQQYNQEASQPIPRSELFITSKVFRSLPDVRGALRGSLEKLQTDYLDLYLIHAPFFPQDVKLEQVWADMESLVDEGLVRSIGVSNFRVEDLQRLVGFARIKPAVNQVELHPYLQQPALVQFAQQHGITLASYSSLTPLTRAAGGPVDAVVDTLSAKYNLTPAQVLVKWSLQQGRIVVTTSSSAEHQQSTLEAYRSPVQLEPDEIAAISSAGAHKHYRQFWVEQHRAQDEEEQQRQRAQQQPASA